MRRSENLCRTALYQTPLKTSEKTRACSKIVLIGLENICYRLEEVNKATVMEALLIVLFGVVGLNPPNDETSDSSDSSSEDDKNVFDDEYLHRSSLYMPSNTVNSIAKPPGRREKKEKEEVLVKLYF
jgi:hypothetical protein